MDDITMSEEYTDFLFNVERSNDSRGKWSAIFLEAEGADPLDLETLRSLTGYGDTQIEALADLLNFAVAERKRRQRA